MKEKLTLTIDRAAITRARAFAKRERTSLSQIVEKQFNRLEAEAFVEKWGGQFKEPPPDPSDPRLSYLRKKYLGAKRPPLDANLWDMARHRDPFAAGSDRRIQ